MKVYIEEKIICECQKEDLPLLKEFSVKYILREVLNDDWLCKIEIPEQKITLNEYDMNGIFDIFLYDTKIEYANMGCLGDDFSLNVYNKKDIK